MAVGLGIGRNATVKRDMQHGNDAGDTQTPSEPPI